MPHFYNNTEKVAVTVEELVPRFWRSQNVLSNAISRNHDNIYGIKALQRGCRGRQLLVDFDTLPAHIQEKLEDPRKLPCALLYFYKIDSTAVEYYTNFRRPDGTYLGTEEQQRYITNASVLIALLQLRERHITERIKTGMSLKGIGTFLCNESNLFNEYLEKKEKPMHNLPTNPIRFKEALSAFEIPFNDGVRDWPYNYFSVIKDVEGKRKANAIKVDERVNAVLNGLFQNISHKPTVKEVYNIYDAFLSGYTGDMYNEDTGEVYSPKEMPKLSESTVRNWLNKWENRAATHLVRAGDRQKYMTKYKPFHQLERVKYASSLISVDDRQPPFKDLQGNRIWFYNGIDVASECWTTFVHGKEKAGIILEFYRQMVRNYTQWGLSLPAEIEAEAALNSSFKDTFLQEGYMFENVRIEANNARGKWVERQNGKLRYELEKKMEGWIGRPHARSEANQNNAEKVKKIPYEQIVEQCVRAIYEWNNSPHSQEPSKTRWEYFLEHQHPELKPTNWKAILPYLGYKQPTSCHTGYIKLKGKHRAIAEDGKILTGDALIEKMKQIEGKEIEVYWLDNNQGEVLKALAYYKERLICEVMEMPTYSRAKKERTTEDEDIRTLQSSYVATVEGFIQKQKKQLQNINVFTKPKAPVQNSFFIPGIDTPTKFTPNDTEEIEDILATEETTPVVPEVSWKKAFYQ